MATTHTNDGVTVTVYDDPREHLAAAEARVDAFVAELDVPSEQAAQIRERALAVELDVRPTMVEMVDGQATFTGEGPSLREQLEAAASEED